MGSFSKHSTQVESLIEEVNHVEAALVQREGLRLELEMQAAELKKSLEEANTEIESTKVVSRVSSRFIIIIIIIKINTCN
jgi:hypothetical protein